MDPIRMDGYSVHFHDATDEVQIVSPDGDGLLLPYKLVEAIVEARKPIRS